MATRVDAQPRGELRQQDMFSGQRVETSEARIKRLERYARGVCRDEPWAKDARAALDRIAMLVVELDIAKQAAREHNAAPNDYSELQAVYQTEHARTLRAEAKLRPQRWLLAAGWAFWGLAVLALTLALVFPVGG